MLESTLQYLLIWVCTRSADLLPLDHIKADDANTANDPTSSTMAMTGS